MSELERLREKLELARDDYNQCGGGVDDRISDRFIKHADALIAALEADKEAMRGTITHQTNIINHAITSEQHLRERAEQAEADLAELAAERDHWKDLAALTYRWLEAKKSGLEQAEAEVKKLNEDYDDMCHSLEREKNYWRDEKLPQAEAEVARLREELKRPPTIMVKWTKDGWTNSQPVELHCETDGYIDWPVKLTIADLRARAEGE